MKYRTFAAACAVAAVLGIVPIDRAALADATSSTQLIERGKYLATDAGQCADCHGATLHGALIGFPLPPTPDFTKHAPRLAGLPKLTTAEAVHFLQTGMLPNGKPARHPMPAYRFSHDDATALVAYLKSL